MLYVMMCFVLFIWCFNIIWVERVQLCKGYYRNGSVYKPCGSCGVCINAMSNNKCVHICNYQYLSEIYNTMIKDHCLAKNHCSETLNKCKPRGFGCTSIFGDYNCECNSSTFGKNCEYKLEPYHSSPHAQLRHIIYKPIFHTSNYAEIFIYISNLDNSYDLHLEVDNGREVLKYIAKNVCKKGNVDCKSRFKKSISSDTTSDCCIPIRMLFPRITVKNRDFILDSQDCPTNDSVVAKLEHVSIKLFSIVDSSTTQPVGEYNITMVNIYKPINSETECPPILNNNNCEMSMKNAPKYPQNAEAIWYVANIISNNETYCKNGDNKVKWMCKLWKNEPDHNEDNVTLEDRDGNTNNVNVSFPVKTYPVGTYKIKLTATVIQNSNVESMYCYFKIVSVNWKPVIIGGSLRELNYMSDLKLEVEQSKDSSLRDLKWDYVWQCNDTENFCNTYNTSESKRYIRGPFLEGKIYNFTLQMSSPQGNPPEIASQVIVILYDRVPALRIDCLHNCGGVNLKSNPAQTLYLKVSHVGQMGGDRNNDFMWTCEVKGSKTNISVNDIRELGTPSNIFIVKKHSLQQGESYVFSAIGGSKIPGTVKLEIEMGQSPKEGLCNINPEFGVRGETSFQISCTGFVGKNEAISPTFDFYDTYSGDIYNGRMLGSNSYGSIADARLTRGNVVIQVFDSVGMFVVIEVRANLTVEVDTSETIKQCINKIRDMSQQGISQTIQIVSVVSDLIHNTTEKSLVAYLLRAISKEDVNNLGDMKLILSTLKILILNNTFINSTVGNASRSGLECSSINHLATILSRLSETFYSLSHFQLSTDEAYNISLSLIRCARIVLITKDNTLANKSYEVFDYDKYKCFKNANLNLVYSLNNIVSGYVLQILPFMNESIIKTEEITAWVKEDTPMAINNSTFADHSIKISPKLAGYLNKFSKFIIFEVVQLNNPYWWSRGDEMNTEVVYLKLRYKSTVFRQISNLKYPLEIFLKHSGIKVKIISGNVKQPNSKLAHHLNDLVISVHKIQPKIGDKVFMKFTNFNDTNVFKVLALCDLRPDYEYMTSRAVNITKSSPSYDFEYVHCATDAIYYIGILPGPGVAVGDVVSYEFELHTSRCQIWKHNIWVNRGCVVGKATSHEVLQCQCTHLSMFGGSIEIPPISVNPFTDFPLLLTKPENPYVIIFVLTIFIFFCILLFYTRSQDKNDKEMRNVISLVDNFPEDKHGYLVTVYTGSRLGSGTTSNIGITLFGSQSKSRAHILRSTNRYVLKRGYDDWFLLFTPNYLGVLTQIHLWNDYSGSYPNWYCDKILVYELRTKIEYVFLVECWLGIMQHGQFLEAIIRPAILEDINRRARLAVDNTILGFREVHELVSIVSRHPRSVVTRTQRLSIAMCTVMVTLLSSTMFYGLENDEDYNRYMITGKEFVVGLFSFLISLCLEWLVLFSFRKSYVFHKNNTDDNYMLDKSHNLINVTKINIPLMGTFVKKMREEQLLPVQLTATKRSPVSINKKWLSFAWLLSMIILSISSYYVVLFGMTCDKVKSLEWLTSAALSIVEGSFIASPAKIITISIILGLLAASTIYDVACYDSKTENELLNRKVVCEGNLEKLLKIRSHPMYYPPRRRSIELVREKYIVTKEICSLLDFLVLLLFTFVLFGNINAIDFQMHYATNGQLLRLLTEKKHTHRSVYGNINVMQTFMDDLQTRVLRVLFSTEWYNRKHISVHGEAFPASGWIMDGCHRMIGTPRLRQLRVKSNSCDSDPIFSNLTDNCYATFSLKTEDRNIYMIGWESQRFNYKEPAFSPWSYRDDVESHSASMYGSSGIYYPGGGYVANLKRTRSLSEDIITNLVDTGWLDKQTRVLFFELTMYNVNTNVFTFIALITEYIPVGYFSGSVNIISLRFPNRTSVEGLIFIGFVCFFTLRLILVVNRIGFRQFVSSVWNIYDGVLIILGGVCIITQLIYKSVASVQIEDFQRSGKDQYFKFHPLFEYFIAIQNLFVTLFCCTIIRILTKWQFGSSYKSYYCVLLYSWTFIFFLTIILVPCIYIQWRFIACLLAPIASHVHPILILKDTTDRVAEYLPFGEEETFVLLVALTAKIVMLLLLTVLIYYYKRSINQVESTFSLNYYTLLSELVKTRFKLTQDENASFYVRRTRPVNSLL